MAIGFAKIAEVAEIVRKHPNEKLTTLVHYINVETLGESYRKLEENKATGVDRITKQQYGENLQSNLEELVTKMKNQDYKPQPVRRTYIPKEGSDKLRNLGIPALEDKIVQGVIGEILNEIYEPKFMNFSFGFRPKRSCHEAIIKLNEIIENRKVSFIVDADIKGFFDNMDQEWIMKFLGHEIGDQNLLRIIKRFLIAGIMEDGKWSESTVGAPQGGLISPIIGNIYLHYVLDIWFDRVMKKQCIGESHIVRYADDFVCCFQFRDDAERFYAELVERLAKFKLEIAEEKSRIIEFGRFAEGSLAKIGKKTDTFDFLGFTHYCGKSRNGKFRVKRVTSKKKLKAKGANIKKWMRENITKPIVQVIKELNIKLRGHYNYYGITDNTPGIKKFAYIVRRALFKHINRRRQGKPCNFLKFEKLLTKHPLLPPRICVNIYKT